MTLLHLLIILVVLGIVGFAITRIPMEATIRTVIVAVLVIVALLVVLQGFGVLHVLDLRVGPAR